MSAPPALIRRAARTVLPALAVALLPCAAGAQRIRPWTPAAPDSMLSMAAEARVSFRANRGDSVTGPNFHAYDVVGRMAMRQVRSLGRNHLDQAKAIEGMLDSLGLDTSIAFDPAQPTFLLVMVHDPFRRSVPAVGFLYWHRGEELRWQGSVYRGGRSPQMRVWWTGLKEEPYHVAVVDRVFREPVEERRLTVFALNPAGTLWSPVQYEGAGPDLSSAREVSFSDLNGDGRPELVAWTAAEAESLFEIGPGCEPVLTEQIWAERDGRYQLEDSRIVPSPLSTFVVFIRLLREGNREAAARLLVDPARVKDAVDKGWAGGAGRGLWSVEFSEAPWPRWLAVRYRGGKDQSLYTVRFTQRDMRWVIADWIRQVPPVRGGAARDSAGAGARRAPGAR